MKFIESEAPSASGRTLTVVAAIFILYATVSYYSDSTPEATGLATGLSLAPVLLIGAVFVWRWTPRFIATAIFIVTGGLLYHYWSFLKSNYQWSNLAQQAGAYGLVALSFVRSLLAGRVPLCTQIAEKLHGPLIAAEIAYTRRATVAWATFYVLLTLAIVVVFFDAPLHVWSLFVNFATFGLIGLMFIAEHLVRRRVLPHHPRGTALSALRQFLGM